MLSALEIVELERKVLRYRLKKRIHFIIVSIVILSVGIIGFYIYPIILNYTNVPTKIQTSTETIKPIENNLTAVADPIIISESNNSINKDTPKVIEEGKEDQTLFLQLPIISKNSVEKKASYIPDIIEKKADIGVQEEELNNKILMRKMPSIEEESFYRNKEDKVDSALLPPPLLDEPKQKGIIKIETHEVNSIQYLKDKFEKTHNIVFALMLAEEYYSTKNYAESNKWALIANNVDPDSEKSWIWFAKSKIKLGHKEDAVLALQAYLKNNKSKAAQSLLNQISVGEVLD